MFSPFLLFSRLVFSPSSLVDDFSPGHSSLRYTSSRRLVVLVYNCIQRTYTLQHIRYTNNFSKYTISSLPHIISNYRPSTDNRITYICILNVAFFPPFILAIRTRRLRSRRVDVEFVVLSSIVLLFDRLACRSREREREREREVSRTENRTVVLPRSSSNFLIFQRRDSFAHRAITEPTA